MGGTSSRKLFLTYLHWVGPLPGPYPIVTQRIIIPHLPLNWERRFTYVAFTVYMTLFHALTHLILTTS